MKNKKNLLIISLVIIIVICSIILLLKILKNKPKTEEVISNSVEQEEEVIEKKPQGKVDIIDINSTTRPYAIVVNNTPVAVKVQTGLNKAYLVYEIPTEGDTSRLMALYKDINEDLKVGTIRSSRHNFIDYALESDSIYVHFGWSHYSEDDQKAGSINYLNGLFDKPFWRENPENLATEHTAYTSIGQIKDSVASKGYKTESDKTILLKYNTEDTDLSQKEGTKQATKVTIPYGSSPNITTFEYNQEEKMYNRMENGEQCIDYETKEKINTKNIIIQKINYSMCDDNYYWDLKTIGTGDGYFITNGYAVPIKWTKESRSTKTKYTYLDGTEINVSDGRTYIELQTNKKELTIE